MKTGALPYVGEIAGAGKLTVVVETFFFIRVSVELFPHLRAVALLYELYVRQKTLCPAVFPQDSAFTSLD